MTIIPTLTNFNNYFFFSHCMKWPFYSQSTINVVVSFWFKECVSDKVFQSLKYFQQNIRLYYCTDESNLQKNNLLSPNEYFKAVKTDLEASTRTLRLFIWTCPSLPSAGKHMSTWRNERNITEYLCSINHACLPGSLFTFKSISHMESALHCLIVDIVFLSGLGPGKTWFQFLLPLIPSYCHLKQWTLHNWVSSLI